jgi:hypothetical protein
VHYRVLPNVPSGNEAALRAIRQRRPERQQARRRPHPRPWRAATLPQTPPQGGAKGQQRAVSRSTSGMAKISSSDGAASPRRSARTSTSYFGNAGSGAGGSCRPGHQIRRIRLGRVHRHEQAIDRRMAGRDRERPNLRPLAGASVNPALIEARRRLEAERLGRQASRQVHVTLARPQLPGHCPRCGIDLNPCPFCSDELAGKRRPLAPSMSDPLHAIDVVRVPGACSLYSALSLERRRPPVAFWRRPE